MVLFGQVINICSEESILYQNVRNEMKRQGKMFDPLQQKPIDEDHDASY